MFSERGSRAGFMGGKWWGSLVAGPEVVEMAKPGQGTVAAENVRLSEPIGLILVQIDRCLDSVVPGLASVLCVIIRQVHGEYGGKNTITTRRLPPAPSVGWIGMPGDNSVARQRAPVSDALNDEQWGNHLSIPSQR